MTTTERRVRGPRGRLRFGRLKTGLVVATVLSMSSPAFAQSYEFVTANKALADLPEQMSAYYTRLSKVNELPVRRVKDDIGLEVRHIAYALGLLVSGQNADVMPASLDKLLCSLNPHVCEFDAAGKASWRNRKDSVICVPSVAWTNAVNLTRVQKPRQESFQWFEKNFGTCSALESDSCKQATSDIFKWADTKGNIRVPVLAQAALKVEGLPITTCNHAEQSGELSNQLTPKGDIYLRDHARQLLDYKKTGKTLSSSEQLELVASTYEPAYLEEGSARLIGSESAFAFSANAQAIFTQEVNSHAEPAADVGAPAQTASAIQPPPTATAVAATAATIVAAPPPAESFNPPIKSDALTDSEIASVDAGAVQRAGVLVFDFPSDLCHSLLRLASRRDDCPNAAGPPYLVLPDARPQRKHHGNHIAGLIAGSSGIGVLPNGQIKAFSLVPPDDPDRTTADYNMEQVISHSMGNASGAYRVANFSVDFNLAHDPVVNAKIAATFAASPMVLMVAAAGDEAVDLDGVCAVLPACLPANDSDNIMVVGGAQREGDSWRVHSESAYGRRVDMLAPAANVLSAAADDGKLVRLSGSSQAAAIVSGVAARLFDAKAPQGSPWVPAQIKHRLKASALLTEELDDKTSSGLLNGVHALNVSEQFLRYLPPDSQTPVDVHGQLVGLIDADGKRVDGFFPVEAEGLHDPHISFCRVYRYSRYPNGRGKIFYEPDSQQAAARWTLMDTYPKATYQISSKRLVFRTREAPLDDLVVPLSRVIDFIDKFSGERACSFRESPPSQ